MYEHCNTEVSLSNSGEKMTLLIKYVVQHGKPFDKGHLDLYVISFTKGNSVA